MSYREISDRFWERVAPLLEPFKRRKPGGSKPLDFRAVLNLEKAVGQEITGLTGGCEIL